MTNPIKYVVLNGPPSTGKSTIAVELCRDLNQALGGKVIAPKVITDSFSAPLKHFFAAALAEPYGFADKEKARPELSGFSMRQSLIMLAEDHCKKVYGPDIFGKWLMHRVLKKPHMRPEFVIIDDGGFPKEIDALPNPFVVWVRRPGKTFDSDSRGWYDKPSYTLLNDGDMAALWSKLKALTGHLLGGPSWRNEP
jgi:hypothetical protein